jgi:putative oxidoreductase
MIRRFLKPANLPATADWGVLILRIGVSLMMLSHGMPKFNKLMDGDHAFADPIGVGQLTSLVLAVGAEVICSLLLILGLGSRAVLIPLIFTMCMAVFVIHASDPYDVKEHALLFLVSYIALFFTGPGKISLDKKLF